MIQPKDTDWLKGCENKNQKYAVCTKDPLESKGHIQTESERIEENTTCKQKSKESGSSNIHNRQNRL